MWQIVTGFLGGFLSGGVATLLVTKLLESLGYLAKRRIERKKEHDTLEIKQKQLDTITKLLATEKLASEAGYKLRVAIEGLDKDSDESSRNAAIECLADLYRCGLRDTFSLALGFELLRIVPHETEVVSVLAELGRETYLGWYSGTQRKLLSNVTLPPDHDPLSQPGKRVVMAMAEYFKQITAGQVFDLGSIVEQVFPTATAADFCTRATYYWMKGNLDKALADYNEAMRIDSKYPDSYYGRGSYYWHIGELDKAFADYAEGIRLNPRHADSYYGRGCCYWRKGALEKALTDYSEAIRLDRKHSKAYFGRAYVYGQKSELDHALADYTEAICLDPEYADAYDGRGNVYWRKGEHSKANEDFNEAKRIRADAKAVAQSAQQLPPPQPRTP